MRNKNKGTYRGGERDDTCDHGLSRTVGSLGGVQHFVATHMPSILNTEALLLTTATPAKSDYVC